VIEQVAGLLTDTVNVAYEPADTGEVTAASRTDAPAAGTNTRAATSISRAALLRTFDSSLKIDRHTILSRMGWACQDEPGSERRRLHRVRV
jgi:hypothetical protein